MRTSNPDRLDPVTAERMLDGDPGPAGLHQLLAAAAGPGTASELVGEAAATAAFLDAPRASPLPTASTRRPSMLSTLLSKVLAAKVLAAAVLVAGAGGGVALAANASGAPSAASESSTATSPTAAAEPSEDNADNDEPDKAADDDKSASPDPSQAGLCTAFAAGATDNPGKAADNPAFGSLIEKAGSAEDVDDYCADLEDQRGRSGEAPGQEAKDAAAEQPGNSGDRNGPPANPGPPADRGGANNEGGQGQGGDSPGKSGENGSGGENRGGSGSAGGPNN